MHLELHQLEGNIATYVEPLIYYKDFFPDHTIERVVPTGHVHLIFELDGFVRNTFDNKTLKPNGTHTKVWVSGIQQNYISISAHQNSEMFVVRFKPFGAYPFFQTSIHELSNQIQPAEIFFGTEILALRRDILMKNSAEEKFKVTEQWLNRIFNPDKVPSSEFLKVLEEFQSNPVSKHNLVVESYPKTRKHLIDQFKKFIGVTPKYYHRILRFNEILHQINQAHKIEWSQIAYQCEYTDQSHFIKEFKHFSGINPKKFIQEDYHNYGDNNFFPLDREG